MRIELWFAKKSPSKGHQLKVILLSDEISFLYGDNKNEWVPLFLLQLGQEGIRLKKEAAKIGNCDLCQKWSNSQVFLLLEEFIKLRLQ